MKTNKWLFDFMRFTFLGLIIGFGIFSIVATTNRGNQPKPNEKQSKPFDQVTLPLELSTDQQSKTSAWDKLNIVTRDGNITLAVLEDVTATVENFEPLSPDAKSRLIFDGKVTSCGWFTDPDFSGKKIRAEYRNDTPGEGLIEKLEVTLEIKCNQYSEIFTSSKDREPGLLDKVKFSKLGSITRTFHRCPTLNIPDKCN